MSLEEDADLSPDVYVNIEFGVLYMEPFMHTVQSCSKISNASCLPNKPRQTVQTQIRLLLLKKPSDQGLHYLLF